VILHFSIIIIADMNAGVNKSRATWVALGCPLKPIYGHIYGDSNKQIVITVTQKEKI
jgi:hypothetical protein